MEYLRVLLPSIGVALIFYFVIRAIVLADRNERLQMEEFYAEQDAQGDGREDSPASEVGPTREGQERP